MKEMDKRIEEIKEVVKEIEEGHKVVLTVDKAISGHSFAFMIGVITVLEAEAQVIKNHLYANTDREETDLLLAISKELYEATIETVCASVETKKES